MRREAEETRRESQQLRLRLSKAVSQLEDQYAEAQVLKLKSERVREEVTAQCERERRVVERALKEVKRELREIRKVERSP